MEKDCVAMLKRMYGGDNGSTKEDLMEYGDLLANFFGCEAKGKEVFEAVGDYTWDTWVIPLFLDTKDKYDHVKT